MATRKPVAKKSAGAPAVKKKGAVELASDMDRLVPTGTNRPHAYVLDVDGKSIHAPVGSDRFYAAITSLVDTNVSARVAAHAQRLEDLNPGHGWLKASQILLGTWVEPAGGSDSETPAAGGLA